MDAEGPQSTPEIDAEETGLLQNSTSNRATEVTSDNEKKKKAPFPWRVYSAHVLSTWGDNMWWFAGGCYMLELHKASLRLTAIYGLVIAATVIMFGASIGRWIDRSRRLTAARVFLTIQNTAVSLCALLLAGFITYRSELQDWDEEGLVTYSVCVGAIILASVARLASSGTNIIIQKDWVVVIADGDNDQLAKMNSILRTIELVTYLLAPAAVGQLFTFSGFGTTGILIAGWNVGSMCLEYLLLALIYRKYPALAKKRFLQSDEALESQPALAKELDDNSEKDDKCKSGALWQAYDGWRTYMKHSVMKAGIGLACLYMTVLGFDNITYGFCLMQDVPHAALGGLVGVSALVGVAGSLAYPAIRKGLGIERTGLVGMFLLISSSSLAVVSAFLPGSPMDLSVLVNAGSNDTQTHMIEPSINNSLKSTADVHWEETSFWADYTSVTVFLLGIILARFGLWIVDLTVNQLLQEKVEEDIRGVVNGVQDSLNNSLDLAKCVLVILLPAEETFALLIFASFVSINIGWLMYALYSRSQRGHLFHFSRLVSVVLPDTPSTIKKNSNNNKEEEEKINTNKISV